MKPPSSEDTLYSPKTWLLQAIIGIFLAGKLAKDQLPAYEKMKKDRGLEGGRSENKILLASVAVLLVLIFLVPPAINFGIDLYLRQNHTVITDVRGDTYYLPKPNQEDKPTTPKR